jgi:hypothetical protein
MAVTIPVTEDSSRAGAATRETTRILATEWPIYATLAASAAGVIGLIWDISWHRTIGRDTFWSAPHLLEQLGAVVAGLSCGYIVLRTTFGGSSEERGRSVRFWKFFQAPIGAWVCIWGTITMITSAPFDNWWHNAYGLDVRIISPPHFVLAAGMIGIQVGAMLMALGAQNRAAGESTKRRLSMIFLLAAAIMVAMAGVMIMEDAAFANTMHSSRFYQATSVVFPVFLIAFARASRVTWPATRIAVMYMLLMLIPIWVLQLVPATPRLAPIYNPVTHMVPPPFPLLLVFPAVAFDLILSRYREMNDWIRAIVMGAAFVLVMLAVHWFWADFLLSPGARNFFFAADQWDYSNRLGDWRYRYWNRDLNAAGELNTLRFATGLLIAVAIATVSARIGLAWGKGLSRVKR